MRCGTSWPTLKIKQGNSRLKSKSLPVKLWETHVTQALLVRQRRLMRGLLGSYSF